MSDRLQPINHQVHERPGSHGLKVPDTTTTSDRTDFLRTTRVFCYDVHERLPQLEGVYDLLLLLDVLEHIEKVDEFIDSLLFLLAPAGRIIINVPAGQYLFSAYDRVQGHCRRYSLQGLVEVMHRNGLRVLAASYWGLPLVPFALMRRLFHNSDDEEEVMRKGFLPSGEFANRMLGWICRLEGIPQRLVGTSVMMVVQRE